MFTRKTSVKNTSIDVTLPPPTVLYGITIREQPVGVYLETVRRLGGILYEIFDAVFPEQKPGQVFVSFMTITPEEFKGVLLRVMAIAPEKALEMHWAMTSPARWTRQPRPFPPWASAWIPHFPG